MVTLFELILEGKKVIGIKCPISVQEEKLINTFPIIKYLKSRECWYFPYTAQAFKNFKSLGIAYCVAPTGPVDDLPSKNENAGITFHQSVNSAIAKVNSTIPTVGEPVSDVDIAKKAYGH